MTIRWTIAIYPGSFKRFFYVREIDHVKATFGDWACQCVSFDFIRLKVPYERENDLINFFSEIGGSTKNAASRKSLEIQGYSITKPRTLLKRNLYEN